MSRYINPITDFGFKKLFGEEGSKEILKSFLFHILRLESEITEISFLPQEQPPTSQDERLGIYDLYCIDADENRFIVEMQRAKQIFFKDRSVYYCTFPIAQQAEKGTWTYQLNPVYCVGILNFDLVEDDRYIRTVKLTDIESHEIFYDKLTFVYIELTKFNKGLKELADYADKWIYFLKHLPELQEIPTELSDEPMKSAFQIAEVTAYSEAERFVYERSLKRFRDEYASIQTALVEGEQRGRIKGKQEYALKLMRLKFGSVPSEIERQVQEIEESQRLDLLLEQIITAETISDISI